MSKGADVWPDVGADCAASIQQSQSTTAYEYLCIQPRSVVLAVLLGEPVSAEQFPEHPPPQVHNGMIKRMCIATDDAQSFCLRGWVLRFLSFHGKKAPRPIHSATC